MGLFIKREPKMVTLFKNTAAFVGTLILICLAVCAIAMTGEFIMWLCDLHVKNI